MVTNRLSLRQIVSSLYITNNMESADALKALDWLILVLTEEDLNQLKLKVDSCCEDFVKRNEGIFPNRR